MNNRSNILNDLDLIMGRKSISEKEHYLERSKGEEVPDFAYDPECADKNWNQEDIQTLMASVEKLEGVLRLK